MITSGTTVNQQGHRFNVSYARCSDCYGQVFQYGNGAWFHSSTSSIVSYSGGKHDAVPTR